MNQCDGADTSEVQRIAGFSADYVYKLSDVEPITSCLREGTRFRL
jgi:hypothetical protein